MRTSIVYKFDVANKTFSRGFIALLLTLVCSVSFAKERVIVLTDLSNEPDDEQSLVRFLVYSNEYDVEGIIATTSTHLRENPREDLIHRQLAAFDQVHENLIKHAPGYPSRAKLTPLIATGQKSYGMAAVGDGKTTEGSRLLLVAADRADDRPLWVSIWGGANTLAQALYDARKERTPEEMSDLISKLKVYSISDQDDAGRWLRLEFPELFYIVSPSSADTWFDYYKATWVGISGERFNKLGEGLHMDMVENPWLEEYVIKGHGPLGALYPHVEYIMEGDTPSFLGLINNGLGWTESPAYGGWGGRYVLYQSYAETRPIWTNNFFSRDTVQVNGSPVTSDQATIFRWRKHYQNDFAARMDWCIADEFEKANHNPVAVLNGDETKKIIHLRAKAGDTITLSALGSHDPDHDKLTFSWEVYAEPGLFPEIVQLSDNSGETTHFTIPQFKTRGPYKPEIHIVLTVEDNGVPSLVAYRRAVISFSDVAGK